MIFQLQLTIRERNHLDNNLEINSVDSGLSEQYVFPKFIINIYINICLGTLQKNI